jgi:hypothetical protein
VLLLPTRRTVYRFDIVADAQPAIRDGERLPEIPPLPPYLAPEEADPDEPLFGALVAVDGFLYATTSDKLFCYGPK